MKRICVIILVMLMPAWAFAETLTITGVDDTWLNSGGPTFNYGTSTSTRMGYDTYGAGYEMRGLVRFDFSALGDTAIIESAVLRLYQYDGQEHAGTLIHASRILRTGWTETGATWNAWDGTNPWTTGGCGDDGTDYTSTGQASAESITPENNWVEWDVTEIVQYCQKNVSEIADLLLWYAGTDDKDTIKFYSTEYGGTAYDPQLVITYSIGAVLTVQPGSGDSTIRKFYAGNNYGSYENLYVGIPSTAFMNEVNRICLSFDFSSLPGGAEIYSAYLNLYAYDSDAALVGDVLNAYRLTQTAWVESEVTWNIYSTGNSWATAGGDYTGSSLKAQQVCTGPTFRF